MKIRFQTTPLFPVDGRKSFYDKATVIHFEDGSLALRSYNTIVCGVDPKGGFHRFWDAYSPTTMRHINAFLAYCGGKLANRGGKAWWQSLPVEKRDWWDDEPTTVARDREDGGVDIFATLSSVTCERRN